MEPLGSTASYDSLLSVADQVLTVGMVSLGVGLEALFVGIIAIRIFYWMAEAVGTGRAWVPSALQFGVPVIIFSYMSVNWATLTSMVGKAGVGLGIYASGVADNPGMIVDIFHTTAIILNGFKIAGAVLKYAGSLCNGAWACMGVFFTWGWFWTAAGVIIVAHFILALVILKAILDFKLHALMALATLPFASSLQTAWMAEAGMAGVVRHAIKLGVLSFVVNVANPMVDATLVPETFTVQNVAMMGGTVLMVAVIALGAGALSKGVIAGTPNFGHHSVVGSAFALGRTVAAGLAGPASATAYAARMIGGGSAAAAAGTAMIAGSTAGGGGRAAAAAAAAVTAAPTPQPFSVGQPLSPAGAVQAAKADAYAAAARRAMENPPPGAKPINVFNAGVIRANADVRQRMSDLQNRGYWEQHGFRPASPPAPAPPPIGRTPPTNTGP